MIFWLNLSYNQQVNLFEKWLKVEMFGHQIKLQAIVLSYSLQKNISSISLMCQRKFGSGALSGKMLLVRIFENNKNDAYFRVG